MNYQPAAYNSNGHLETEMITAIESIWSDPKTKACIQERSSEFYLMDSAS